MIENYSYLVIFLQLLLWSTLFIPIEVKTGSGVSVDDSIYIDSNNDFAFKSDSGSGTVEDPYIIANRVIKGGENGIVIMNSDVYFILENNIVTGISAGKNHCAFWFYNISNGIIRNNIANDNQVSGFKCLISYYNSLINNTANNNLATGFSIDETMNNTIANNTANNNILGMGFVFYHLKNTSIINNLARNNIRGLNLRWNKFIEFPKFILNLILLEKLDLAINQISLIPNSIGNLRRLRNLLLNSNNLSSIPKTIANLNHLEELDLSYNYFTVFPKFLINLEESNILKLKNNRIV